MGADAETQTLDGTLWNRGREDCGSQRGQEHPRAQPTTESTKQGSQGLTETKAAIMKLAWVCVRFSADMLYLSWGICGTPNSGRRAVSLLSALGTFFLLGCLVNGVRICALFYCILLCSVL